MPENTQILHADSQEVLLDFVARDRHQKAVTDLRPTEVQVYENGVLQHVNSFRYRAGDLQAGLASHEKDPDPLRELNLVSIVFDGMSAESRRRATEYASEFLDQGAEPNTWIGIFTLNSRISVVQPYTNDLQLLRAAVRHAGTGEYQTFAKESAELLKRIDSLQSARDPETAWMYQPVSPGSAEEQGPATGIGPQAAKMLLAVQKAVLRGLYQQAGTRSIDGLRNLILSQAEMPGRKTVLYICEGLTIPPEQPELLRSIVSEANRANVSFYTLDARGLQMMSGDHVARLATSAMDDDPFSGGTDIPLSRRTDGQANARELAQGTGGFAMDNSNDLRGSLKRVVQDVHAHYEVSYTPQSQILDGSFHTIDMKVLRPGLNVRSRKGYYAVPALHGEPLTLYEMAALRALDEHPSPHAFDFHFAALDLGRTPDGIQYEMTFSAPAKMLRFEKDTASDRFHVHVVCLALIKRMSASAPENSGTESEIVEAKTSKDLPYSVPANRLPEFEAGMITVSIPVILPPGRYHVEVTLLDVLASRAGVRKVPLIVEPAQQIALEVSNFVWVRSLERDRVSEPSDYLNPLATPYGLVVPNITAAFPAGQAPAFLFRVFNVSNPPTAEIVVSRNGTPVRKIAVTLPSPSADGTISFLGHVDGLAAGQYEVELLVETNNRRLTRLTQLILTGN